jgi:hypothetical protein
MHIQMAEALRTVNKSGRSGGDGGDGGDGGQ